jgi:hypothetical protein
MDLSSQSKKTNARYQAKIQLAEVQAARTSDLGVNDKGESFHNLRVFTISPIVLPHSLTSHTNIAH